MSTVFTSLTIESNLNKKSQNLSLIYHCLPNQMKIRRSYLVKLFLFAGVRYPVSRHPCYLDGHQYMQNHERSKKYSCHKCGNVFTRKNNLYKHLKFQCGQMPRFCCPYCSYCTRHSSNVRSHIRRMHHNQRVYVVDIIDNQSKNDVMR